MKNHLYIGLTVLGISALVVCHDAAPTKVLAAQVTPAPSTSSTPSTASPGFVPPAPVQPQVPATPTPVADPVPNVKGDLVIDFLGAVRGYVEPCG